MYINLNELYTKKEVEFSFEVEKDDELDERIKDLKNSIVTGRIYINSIGDIALECNFSGIMTIVDSISLDLIDYNFNFDIEDNLDELATIYENCYEKAKNILDLKKILWQNIVLEVPISYTKVRDAELKGNGWELINEHTKVDEIDPRLKKLEDLLKGDD